MKINLKKIAFLVLIYALFVPFLSHSKINSNNPSKIVIPKIKPGAPLPADLFIQIAKKINPSVVNISTSMGVSSMSNFNLFEQFLFPLDIPRPPTQIQPANSLGSGFIIEEKGYIVTNAHVIERASKIHVQIKNDPTNYEAKVIGKDKATDIALIKISANDSKIRKKFPIVDLGNSNNLQVGEWVAAFGNPFGHSNTMTKGIISAIDRHIDELNLLPFLQTDASINPGNSGGPLVNTQGQVIGVNTAINPRAQNIGFAIPIHNVISILKSLKNDGYVKRGFLGVQMSPNTVEFEYNKKPKEGVLIVNVIPGSPAEKAGIKKFDIVTKFNKTSITSNRDLFNSVSATPVNEKVTGELYRNNKMIPFTVVIRERPRENTSKKTSTESKKISRKAPYNLGFSLLKSNEEIPPNFNLPMSRSDRPVVLEVYPPSPAFNSGLMKGDIIFSVNGENVQTMDEVFKNLTPKNKNVIHVLRYDRPGRFNLKKIQILK